MLSLVETKWYFKIISHAHTLVRFETTVKQIKQATGNGPDQDDARNLMREADQVYREAIELGASNQEERQEKYMEAAELYASAAETGRAKPAMSGASAR